MKFLKINPQHLTSLLILTFLALPSTVLHANPTSQSKVVGAIPKSIKPLIDNGIKYTNQEDYRKATKEFARAYDRLLSDHGAENCKITLFLGMAYVEMGQSPLAYLFLRKTLELFRAHGDRCGKDFPDEEVNWIQDNIDTISATLSTTDDKKLLDISLSATKNYKKDEPTYSHYQIVSGSLPDYPALIAPKLLAFDVWWWSTSTKDEVRIYDPTRRQDSIVFVGTPDDGQGHPITPGIDIGIPYDEKQHPPLHNVWTSPGAITAYVGIGTVVAGGVAMFVGYKYAGDADRTYNGSNFTRVDAKNLHGAYRNKVLPWRTGGGAALGAGAGAVVIGGIWAYLDWKKTKDARRAWNEDDNNYMQVRGISVAPAMDGMNMAINLSF